MTEGFNFKQFNYFKISPSPVADRVPPPVPYMLLKGYWLNKAGFTIGTNISVEVSEGGGDA